MIRDYLIELISLKNYIKMILICKHRINKIKFKHYNPTEDKNIYVYLNDWLLSPMPIFHLYKAIALKKGGYKTIILFDRFNLYSPIKSFIVNYYLVSLIKLVQHKFNIEYLELNEKNETTFKLNKNIIKNCLKFNLMRYQKDVKPKWFNSRVERKKIKELLNIFKNFKLIINRSHTKKNIFLLAGGMLNSSYVFTEILKKEKKIFYTSDSCPYGKSHAIWYCKNGIAGKLQDAFASFNELTKEKYFTKKKFGKIKNIIKNELNSRKISNDKFGYQKFAKKKYKLNLQNYIVITINSGWDANSLGSDYLFKDYIDYLSKTIKYIQIKFPKIKIVIKDHPHRNIYNKNDSIQKYIFSLKGKNIIKIGKEYNFYDVVKNSKLLISIASTTINEALILNKPAISAGKDKYFYFGLNINFSSQKKYFDTINKIIKSKKPLKSNKFKSSIFYYFNQKVRLFKTKYSPQTYSWTSHKFKNFYTSDHFIFVSNMLKNSENYFTSRVKFLIKKDQL